MVTLRYDHKLKVMEGSVNMNNTLADVVPSLINEWSEKNLPLTPEQITYGSNKIVWWKGRCGHEWQSKIKNRSGGEGCPFCSGKRVLIGFNDLQSRKPGLVEEWSERNEDTYADYTYQSHKKVWWTGKCGHEWMASIKNRVNGSGCPYCSGNALLKGISDFETLYPEIALEWSDKNEGLSPDEFLPNSNRKVWWKDDLGHEWMARISDRVRGSGCPYCSGARIFSGFNDLATLYPSLIYEWDDINVENPSEISPKSMNKYWWKCSKCGSSWQSSPYKRVHGNKCPVCFRGYLEEGINDLCTTDKTIAALWHDHRNGTKKPNKYTRNSAQFIWWQGSCGHEWRERIIDMVASDGSCPICESGFLKDIERYVLLYYFKKAGYSFLVDDEDTIGLKLDILVPDLRSAFIFGKKKTSIAFKKESLIVNHLCNKSGIKLFRIICDNEIQFEDCINIVRDDESLDSIEDTVKAIFDIYKISSDVNIIRDLGEIRNLYNDLYFKSKDYILNHMKLGP